MAAHSRELRPRDSSNVFENWSAEAVYHEAKRLRSPLISRTHGWWRCWQKNLEYRWNGFQWLRRREATWAPLPVERRCTSRLKLRESMARSREKLVRYSWPRLVPDCFSGAAGWSHYRAFRRQKTDRQLFR